jgi:hypothetical protein
MKYTKQLFDETIAILVQAYINETLRHNDCSACAVGNIVSSRINAEEPWCPSWYSRYHPNGFGLYFENQSKEMGEKEIAATGYSPNDILKIEYAFESCERPEECEITDDSNEEWMFNGLMAVVDVLIKIHELGETEKQEAKAMFVKA